MVRWHPIQKPFTPRTDDLYDLFPLDDLDISRADIYSRSCMILGSRVAAWDPYNLHEWSSTCFSVRYVLRAYADPAQPRTTTAGEELLDLQLL